MFSFIYKHSLSFSVTWAIIIIALCATPGQYVPSAKWLDLLSFDKFVHASIFFVQCSLLIFVSKKYHSNENYLWLYFSACILFGGALEIMQAKVFSNRSGDWLDFIANSIGCIAALLTFKNKKMIRHFE
jgi:hypothetical protein